jgi:flagellar hook-length control protein FliK
VEDDLLAFNPSVSADNQPLDLTAPNIKIDTLNQVEAIEQVLVREDNPTLPVQEITSTVQAGLMASNAQSQGVVQGTVSTQSVSTGTSQNVVSWGVQGADSQASQGFGQQGQSFGQSSQNSSGQPTHQQAMMFAQMSQGDKQQALEQQAAVRSVNETLAKAEGRELLGGAEIASLDRKGGLPPGLQTINLPLKHPQWGQSLGQRIVFMSNNSLQQAQITLNPQNLGQIQVTLQLDKEQKMHISLAAQNGMTRESMESALPRLREMMEQAGVQVASVDIREQKQTFSENESSHAQNGKNRTEHSLAEEAFVEESALATVGSTDNIVDYYA